MKYLSDNPNTEKLLLRWAGNAKLVTASFYFWNSGNEMQKSQQGLLQSLLYEVFRRCPELIKVLCPSRWDHTERNTIVDTSWDLSELAQTMRLTQQRKIAAKFCFCIDGLDEYVGDHHEIIRVLDVFNTSPNIKICLSSRPWNVFEDAYGQNPAQKLYLQDLTRGDSELYVRDKLENHKAFQLHVSEESHYQNLIDQTVKKSAGVFLWVFLTVRSLLEGLTNEDNMRTLEARLSQLPVDLDDYFQHILNGVDVVYKKDMVRTFQEALQATEPLTMITHSFLEEAKTEFALQMNIGELDRYDIYRRNSKMRRRLNARCKGLLEDCLDPSATDYWSHRVEFLHRTVRDFLSTKGIQSMLKGDVSFNPNRSLCRGYLAVIKSMPKHREDFGNQATVRHQLNSLLYHAAQAEAQSGISDRDLFDNIELTLENLTLSKQDWTLPKLAVANGLDIYVTELLCERPSLRADSEGSILGFALHECAAPAHGEFDNSKMVHLLLDHGADANARPVSGPERHHPFWASWLMRIAKDYESAVNHGAHRLQTLETLLHYGADPNAENSEYPEECQTVWSNLLQWLYSVRADRKTVSENMYLYQIVDALLRCGASPHVTIRSRVGNLHLSPITLGEIFHQFPRKLTVGLSRRVSTARNKQVTPRVRCFADLYGWVFFMCLNRK